MTDFLTLAREAYEGSTMYFNASIRKTVEANIRQFQGVHPAGSKYHSDTYKARSRLFRPKTRSTVRRNEAVAAEAFFSTNDVVSVAATDDDDKSQLASAELHQALLQYRLTKTIPWFATVLGAYQDAQTVGVAVGHPWWEYDPKRKVDRPRLDLIPIENIRIDPAANWTDPINSSPYVIRLIPMYVKDVRARMRLVDPKTGQPKWKLLDDSAILTAMHGMSDTIRLTRERGRTDSTAQVSAVKEFSVVWVHENIINIDGQDQVYYTLGVTGMLSDPKPLEQVYFHGRRPFVMGVCTIETHKIYPAGPVEIGKDLQIEINELANQRIDNVKFAMNKRYFVKRAAQVDLRSLTRNVPGSATMMNDPEKDVIIQSTPDVTSSSYQEQDRLNADFDDLMGNFSQSSVDTNRRLNETVGGMNLLSTTANQVSGYQLRTFVQTWVEPILEQLVLLEQHYETDEVVLAMAAKKADIQRFGINEVTDDLLMKSLTLTVNVGMGATNPHQQVQNFMEGMRSLKELLADGTLEKYGLDVQEIEKELFGKLGYKDGARFFNTEGIDPSLLAAQKTISQLQQQLAAKQAPPELIAAQVDKLRAEVQALDAKTKDTIASAVEKGMRAIFASMQAGEVVAAIPKVAPIADALMNEAKNPSAAPATPQPAAAAEEIGINAIKDRRTGTEFNPNGGTVPQNTDPVSPALPASPETGAEHGIETMRADSA